MVEPLPDLPILSQDFWYPERAAWDESVRQRLEGYLAIENILQVVVVSTGDEPRPNGEGVVVWIDKEELGAPNAEPDDIIVTATTIGSGGTGTALARTTGTYVTTSIAPGARDVGVISLAKIYTAIHVDVDRPCRVRLYDSAAHRDADLTRPRGEDPDPEIDSGLMLDYAFYTADPRTLTPPATGATFGGTASVPITVDNLDDETGTVTVVITYLPLEQ